MKRLKYLIVVTCLFLHTSRASLSEGNNFCQNINYSCNVSFSTSQLINNGDSYKSKEMYLQAIECYQRVIDINHSNNQPENLQEADIYIKIAECNKIMKIYPQSFSYFQKALDIKKIKLYSNDIQIGQILNYLGYLCVDTQQYNKAIVYLMEALKTDWKYHIKSIDTKYYLAYAYQKEKKYEMARKMFTDVVLKRSIKLGKYHEKTIKAQKKLMMVLQRIRKRIDKNSNHYTPFLPNNINKETTQSITEEPTHSNNMPLTVANATVSQQNIEERAICPSTLTVENFDQNVGSTIPILNDWEKSTDTFGRPLWYANISTSTFSMPFMTNNTNKETLQQETQEISSLPIEPTDSSNMPLSVSNTTVAQQNRLNIPSILPPTNHNRSAYLKKELENSIKKADTHHKNGKYKLAINDYIKSVDLYRVNPNKKRLVLALIYNNMGMSYLKFLKHNQLEEKEEKDILYGIEILYKEARRIRKEELRKHPSDKNISEALEKSKQNIATIEIELNKIKETIEEPRSKICPIPTCNKKFRTPGEMENHFRTHTQEKPFKCPICPKYFSLKKGVGLHMRIHSGDKLLECSICEERFDTKLQILCHQAKAHRSPEHNVHQPPSKKIKTNLIVHLKNVHGIIIRKSKSAAIGE